MVQKSAATQLILSLQHPYPQNAAYHGSKEESCPCHHRKPHKNCRRKCTKKAKMRLSKSEAKKKENENVCPPLQNMIFGCSKCYLLGDTCIFNICHERTQGQGNGVKRYLFSDLTWTDYYEFWLEN